jgi:ABC-type multidrug transport system fused ATPase/permease subunit
LSIFSFYYIGKAERQSRAMRKKLFSSILRQEMGWFDCYKNGELVTRMTDDIDKVKDAIGLKFANFLSSFCTLIA